MSKRKRKKQTAETQADQAILHSELTSPKYRAKVERDRTKYKRSTKHRNGDCGIFLIDKP